MDEVEHQTNIKLAVRRQGGYSFKLSNQFTIGIPDLFIALPPFVPCVAEVKDLKEVYERFDLQLQVTPKQDHELKSINGAYEEWYRHMDRRYHIGFLLVVFKWMGKHRIVALPQGTKRLSAKELAFTVPMWDRIPGADGAPPSYNMRDILTHMGVPKI